MSDTLAHLAACLPPDFLTAGDMDLLNNHHHRHFPYDFTSSSSTESESDEDDVTGLTHRFARSVSVQAPLKIPQPPLQKKRVFSGSPESTLSWNVSPTTSFLQASEDCWELIYAARMRMKLNDGVLATGGLLGGTRPIWSENQEFMWQQNLRRRVANYNSGRPVGFRRYAWAPVHVESQRRQQPANGFVVRPVVGRSSSVCGIRAGTGVFLPRNHCNVPPESKKKPACSPIHLPAGIAHSLNKNMDPTKQQPQTNIHGGFVALYQVPPPMPPPIKRNEPATATHNTVRLAQGQAGEVVLPQEWTY